MQKELRENIEELPKSPGVYLYRNKEGEALYVGKAVDIRNRVRSYFQDSANLGPKTRHMVDRIASIEHFETESEFTALLLEADLIKRLKPKYNQRFKDGKTYPLIEITKERYPRVQVTRKKREEAEYFGPYPHGNIRKVLRLLRKSFPFRNCSNSKFARYKKLGRGCLFADIDLCPAPCVGKVTGEEYKVTLNNLKYFLQGKGSKVIKDLERAMTELSKQEKFEEAAEIRDQLDNLEYIRRGFRTATQEELDINLPEDRQQKELKALKKALNLPKLPKRIEAYDISNLQGKEATGSMVVFENARAKKSHYRRFKIRMEGEPDDVGMMREVLRRRFSRIDYFNCKEASFSSRFRKEAGRCPAATQDKNIPARHLPRGEALRGEAPKKQRALKGAILERKEKDPSFQSTPDLILIDGGKGQLNAAVEVLRKKKLKIPAASIAKREEDIFYAGELSLEGRCESLIIEGPISLSKESPALKLLQRIRDESHRFALAYHRKLRSKKLQ